MEEYELIQAATQGDLEAFNQIVLAYQDRVYNLAYRILGQAAPAEDVAQEAFLTAYLKLQSYRGGSFKSWLMRITTNLCYDQLRREKSRPSIPLEPLTAEGDEVESASWMVDLGPSADEMVEQAEFWEEVQRGLDRIAPEYRAAVVLVDIQGLEYTEAAAAMGVAIGTLKSRLVRGRLKMRELLESGSLASSSLSARLGVAGVKTGDSYSSHPAASASKAVRSKRKDARPSGSAGMKPYPSALSCCV